MNLFKRFMFFFGISTMVGVPLLSSFQVVQIKGSTIMDWVSGLGATLGPATGIFLLVSALTYVFMKPLLKSLKDSETRELTDDEKIQAEKVLKKVNLLSTISIMLGYPIGNGTTIIIKTLTGKLRYSTVDITVIMVLIFLYAFLAIQYSVTCFNATARDELSKLKIHSTKGFKTQTLSFELARVTTLVSMLIGWHLFCSGYGAIRNGWDMQTFIKMAIVSIVIAFIITVPLYMTVLYQLKLRFKLTIKQIESLREDGNLTTRLDIGTFDDFGRVMTQMNHLMDFLHESLSTLKRETGIVDANAKELFDVTENSSAGMAQIVSAFETVHEQNAEEDKLLESTKLNIQKLSDEALKVSSYMEEQAEAEANNSKAITKMVGNFNSVADLITQAQNLSSELTRISQVGKDEVAKTQSIIATISEKSTKMIEVTKVIQQVASKTNLLAMNAAIEAAHAGEAGKGFSVVADEIRKLSVNTQQSVKNISDLITEVVESMSGGIQSMNDTSTMFGSIRSGIENQTHLVEVISKTVTEQTAAANSVLSNTEDIVRKVNDVNHLVKNQANYAEEIRNGIEDVVDLSVKVNTSMKESEEVIREFESSIFTVQEKASQNKQSVIYITDELNKFEL